MQILAAYGVRMGLGQSIQTGQQSHNRDPSSEVITWAGELYERTTFMCLSLYTAFAIKCQYTAVLGKQVEQSKEGGTQVHDSTAKILHRW